MRSQLLGQDGRRRTYMLVFDIGDEIAGGVLSFATENALRGSYFTGVGAFEDAVLGWFDWEAKVYRKLPIREQVEVVSFAGNIAVAPNGEPVIHAHVAVAKHDGSAWGGHLLEAHARPTLEVVLHESSTPLRREMDPRYGVAFIATG